MPFDSRLQRSSTVVITIICKDWNISTCQSYHYGKCITPLQCKEPYIAHSPGHGALLAGGRGLVRLALNAYRQRQRWNQITNSHLSGAPLHIHIQKQTLNHITTSAWAPLNTYRHKDKGGIKSLHLHGPHSTPTGTQRWN